MNATQFANKPVTLTIDTVDASGSESKLSLALSRSLPAAEATALRDDLAALGKRTLTPHSLMKPQLDALARDATAAQKRGDMEEYAQLRADRSEMLRALTEGIVSGAADDLAQWQYIEAARKTPDGIVREVLARIKAAGGDASEAQLRAVITYGNAGMVAASLKAILAEAMDPSAAT